MSTDNRRQTRSSIKAPSNPTSTLRSKKTTSRPTLQDKKPSNSSKPVQPTELSTSMENNNSSINDNNGPATVSDEGIIMNQLKSDIAGLSPDLTKLAQAIVKALITVSDAKLDAERRRHDKEVEGLRLQIQELSEQKDDLENYGRRNTIVISGPSITPVTTHEDTYTKVIDIVKDKLGVQLARQDIDVCHRLPSPRGGDPNRQPDPSKKPIIVKFVRREVKHQVLHASRNRRPRDIYFNESLSSTRQKILYVIRKVKANHDSAIASYKTEDCNIRVYSPSPGESPTPRFTMATLNTRRELDNFLFTKLGFRSTRYLEEKHWSKSNFLHPAPPSGASGVRI